MIIRQASLRDIEKLWQIRNSAIYYGCQTYYSLKTLLEWTPEEPPESFRRLLKDKYMLVVVAESNKKPVSVGYLDINTGVIGGIFTSPINKNLGFGGYILEHFKQVAHDRDISKIFLKTTYNTTLFYKKRGFFSISHGNLWCGFTHTHIPCVNMLYYPDYNKHINRKYKR